jgi:hypothetical protein
VLSKLLERAPKGSCRSAIESGSSCTMAMSLARGQYDYGDECAGLRQANRSAPQREAIDKGCRDYRVELAPLRRVCVNVGSVGVVKEQFIAA